MKEKIIVGILAVLVLSGCSVKIFKGNWRYDAELEARAHMGAERVQPPQTLTPVKTTHEQ